jgi:hypothetical protein
MMQIPTQLYDQFYEENVTLTIMPESGTIRKYAATLIKVFECEYAWIVILGSTAIHIPIGTFFTISR